MTKNKDNMNGVMEVSGTVNQTQLSLQALESQMKKLEAKMDSQ